MSIGCIEKVRFNAVRVFSLLFCLIMIFGVALTSLVARPLPACASPATPAIAVGDEFVYALDDNGQVWAWGSNDEGQLGDGFMDSTYESNADSAVPVQVSNMSDATAIAAGNLAGYALKSDGTVWTWGYDKVTGNNNLVPVQVPDLTNVTAIAAGPYDGYALRSDGTVWAWGEAGFALGNGSTASANSSVPVQVPDLPYIKAIASESLASNAYALDTYGKVWAWGGGGEGGLGNGSTNDSNVPVQVSNLTNVKAIAGGQTNGYALKSDGSVWVWGNNGENELGNGAGGYNANGSSKISDVPVLVSNLTGVTAIFGGVYGGYAHLRPVEDSGR